MISAWILIILLIIHNVAQSISCRDTGKLPLFIIHKTPLEIWFFRELCDWARGPYCLSSALLTWCDLTWLPDFSLETCKKDISINLWNISVDKELCNIIKEKKHCENEKLKAELKRVCEKTCNLCDYIPPKVSCEI